MDDIGKRVKELREAKKWTQQQLATTAGVSIAYVRNLEQKPRRTQAPSLTHLDRLAKSLGTSVADLTGEVVPDASGGLSLPLVGVVSAGDGADELFDGETLPVHALYPSGTVAYRVRGDSMVDALIADGDYILVRLQPEAQPGEVVVVWVPDVGTVVKLKRKKHYASRNDAKPRNPIPTDGCKEYGVLVGVIRKC